MKLSWLLICPLGERSFSAQPRADGDEAVVISVVTSHLESVSVLNREPMGMKRAVSAKGLDTTIRFSAQPRADGDEARREPRR